MGVTRVTEGRGELKKERKEERKTPIVKLSLSQAVEALRCVSCEVQTST
jgi:hypothetical protein